MLTVDRPPAGMPPTLPGAARTIIALTMSLLLAVGTVVLLPTKAEAATEVRVPLPSGVDPGLTTNITFAAFGSTIVYGARVSTDGGATWSTSTIPNYWEVFSDASLVRRQPASNLVDVMKLSTQAVTTYAVPQTTVGVNSTSALVASGSDYWVQNFVDQTSKTVQKPTGAGVGFSTPLLTSWGGLLWSGWVAPSQHPAWAVSNYPDSPPTAWVTDAAAAVTGAYSFQYAKTSTSGLTLCNRPFAGSTTCIDAASGNFSMSSVNLYDFGGSTVVRTYTGGNQDRDYLWTGSSAVPIALPTGSYISIPNNTTYIHGDTPYVVVRDALTVPSLHKVAANGTLSASIALPTVPTAEPTSLAVTPDRVTGSDARDASTSNALWSRSVSGTGFGAETALAGRTSEAAPTVMATAARTIAMADTSAGVPTRADVYDRGVLKRTFTNVVVGTLSGPYMSAWVPNTITSDSWVKTVDGASIPLSLPSSGYLFGSRLVTDTKDGSATGAMHFLVTDLTGIEPARSFALPAGTASCNVWQGVWGNTVALNCSGETRVYVYTSGELLGSLAGDVYSAELGDGYAVVALGSEWGVWDIASGDVYTLPCADRPRSDGVGHLACTDGADLIWEDFSELSSSAPRLLGVLAASSVDFARASWTPEIDSTKPLRAGSLVITAADGAVVKTLPTPASPDGSLRDLSWNGRDESGNLVKNGSYTYTLTANAQDGSGALVSVGGDQAAKGTITATGYSSFVKATYEDFLGRSPSEAELVTQSANLGSNRVLTTPYLETMANSDEWLTTIVTKMYQDTLGRAPDAAGLAGWTTLIRNETFTVADVASRFYSSDEYYLYHAGGTTTSWVTALYTKLLSRDPDPAGLQHWAALTSDPAFGRNKVAYEFYQSTESRMHRVLDLYQALLKRNPDPTGWPYWTAQVLTTGDITLAINLAGSQEYQLRAEARF